VKDPAFPAANPTVVIYSASAVKIYNGTSSQVRFENRKFFLHKMKNALAYYNLLVNFEVVGLAPRSASRMV
jgi:hypothetical protein